MTTDLKQIDIFALSVENVVFKINTIHQIATPKPAIFVNKMKNKKNEKQSS